MRKPRNLILVLTVVCVILSACKPSTPTTTAGTAAPTTVAATTTAGATTVGATTTAGTTLAPTTSGSGAASGMSDPGILPIVNGERESIRVFYVPSQFVTDVPNNYSVKWYEDKTNIKVDWMLVSTADSQERLNLLLAGNKAADMPDAFLVGMSRQVCEAYGTQGVLADLTSLINQWGVNVKKLLAKDPTLDRNMTAYDGKKYFLFRYYETVHVKHTQRMWMSTKWLKNVGLSEPNTTDEFYNVLKAFKEKDANGNGDPNDEIPFIHFNQFWVNEFGKGLMNSFVFSPIADSKLYFEDGKVKVSYAEPGWREGLRYYKKLYDENLMDRECFSMTFDQAKALAATPTGNRVGSLIGGIVSIFDAKDPTINEFDVIAPLQGPTGLRQSATELFDPAPFFAISGSSNKKELAFRWADAQQYDSVNDIASGDYTWLNLWYGQEGVGWAKSAADATGFTGKKAAYKWLFNWGDTLNSHIYETFLINMPERWKELMEAPKDVGYPQEKILYEATINKMYPYAVNKELPIVSMDEQSSIRVAELETALITYYKEMNAKFVRGEADLDTGWDSYINELKQIGLDEYLDYFQKAYKP